MLWFLLYPDNKLGKNIATKLCLMKPWILPGASSNVNRCKFISILIYKLGVVKSGYHTWFGIKWARVRISPPRRMMGSYPSWWRGQFAKLVGRLITVARNAGRNSRGLGSSPSYYFLLWDFLQNDSSWCISVGLDGNPDKIEVGGSSPPIRTIMIGL